MLVDWRICRARANERIGETVILSLVIVLVESYDQKTIVSLSPLIVAVEILPKPSITGWNALRCLAVMHIVIEVRNNEGDSRQLGIVTRKIFESQVGRSIDCRPVRDVCEADPRDMFAAINAAVSVTIRRVEVNLRANGRKAVCILPERTALFYQLVSLGAWPE